MDGVKPLIVTIFLVCLMYKGSVLYISLLLFLVTVAITYVCFTLNTQLRLEKFIAYLIIRFSFKEPVQAVTGIDDGFQRKHTRLKSLPIPMMKIAQKFITSIINDFIKTWYQEIGPNEKDFIDEVEDALEHVAVGVYLSMKNVDVENVLINLIRMFQRHINIFDESRTMVQLKYPGIGEEDLCVCITELYEVSNIRHIATLSRGTEMDYLKALLDIFLFKFLPKKAFSCEGGRFMLREILTTQLLEPMIKEFTDSYFVNQAVVDILEPSRPLAYMLDKWNSASSETEKEDEHQCCEEDESSGDETDYGSGKEETKFKPVNHQHLLQKSKTPLPPAVRTTRPYKRSRRSRDLQNSRNKELIRFNKLDMRTSAPVYGSYSARDHEKRWLNKHPSARSDPHKRSESDSFISHNEKSISESYNTYNSFPYKEVPSSWTVCPSSDARLFRNNSFHEMPRVQDDVGEQMKARLGHVELPNIKPIPWNQMFTHHRNSRTMPDIELKTRGIRYTDEPYTGVNEHYNTGVSGPGSGAPCIACQDAQTFSQEENELDQSQLSHDESIVSNSPCIPKTADLTHVCMLDNTSQSCPLCIEMTLMASPFEIDKEKVLYDPRKNDRTEHECGLYEKHFYYAETSKMIEPPDAPLVDQRFESCEDIVTETDNCDSFQLQDEDDDDCTLKDCSVDSDPSCTSSIKLRHESYDIVTSHSDEWSNSEEDDDVGSSPDFGSYDEVSYEEHSDEDIDYDKTNDEDEIDFGNDEYDAPSTIATFKTALGRRETASGTILDDGTVGTVGDSYNDIDKLSSTRKGGVRQKLRRSNMKIINFFKGFNSLSQKRKFLLSSKRDGISKMFQRINGGGVGNNSSNNGRKRRRRHQKHRTPGMLSSRGSTRFMSLADHADEDESSVPTHVRLSRSEITGDMEEVGSEVLEDELGDGLYQQYPSPPNKALDPLSKQIAVTSKGVVRGTDISRPCDSIDDIPAAESETVLRASTNEKGDGEPVFLPIFKGEVIQPHPSKIPAAWLYPLQMVSIPYTDIAYEKGWEPGINKYTLYHIHYDVRIWPDIDQHDILGKSFLSRTEDSAAQDTMPHIREIKRRYREFLFLHNRFSHGPLSKHMKGILRPNRRYALPFGRMDPDVIEGRRRILETYLVSVVSRPELCNSREFKEFLGFLSSDHSNNAQSVKTTTIAHKQMDDSQVERIMATSKDQATTQSSKERRGLDSQYFIHGYEVQRMFGYADKSDLGRSSSMLFRYFVNHYDTLEITSTTPHFFTTSPHPQPLPSTSSYHYSYPHRHHYIEMKDVNGSLGIRTAGDGAEMVSENTGLPELHRTGNNVMIAAKFSPELASRLEKDNLELLRAREKDLYESSWPLTDAVLSIVCQALKDSGSWLIFGRVQQAILFSVGGVIEWLIKREVSEFTMKERWYMYMCDIYALVWNTNGQLKEKKPDPTPTQRNEMKEKALQSLIKTIPSAVMMTIGPEKYRKHCEKFLHTLQYQPVNRHLLFAALEIILYDLIPELHRGYPEYLSNLEK